MSWYSFAERCRLAQYRYRSVGRRRHAIATLPALYISPRVSCIRNPCTSILPRSPSQHLPSYSRLVLLHVIDSFLFSRDARSRRNGRRIDAISIRDFVRQSPRAGERARRSGPPGSRGALVGALASRVVGRPAESVALLHAVVKTVRLVASSTRRHRVRRISTGHTS